MHLCIYVFVCSSEEKSETTLIPLSILLGLFSPLIPSLNRLPKDIYQALIHTSNFLLSIIIDPHIPLIVPDVDAVVGTCSAVAELFPGDQVRVTGDEEFSGTARGDGFSGFTGYMITKLD